MNININKEYDNYFDTFSSEGYKQLIALTGERIEMLKVLAMQASDLRALGQIQGEVKAWTTLLSFEEGIRQEHDALQGDSDD